MRNKFLQLIDYQFNFFFRKAKQDKVKNNAWFIATDTFDSDIITDFSWKDYIKWSRLFQLEEVVSLDALLNSSIIEPDFDNDFDVSNLIIEDSNLVTRFFKTQDYVIEKAKAVNFFNLLAIIKEPQKDRAEELEKDFDFIGYDLIEKYGDISAITNCGGFDETFQAWELNKYGLINDYSRALQIQHDLVINNPLEDHADCFIFEVWRHKSIGRKRLEPFCDDFYTDLEYHLCNTFKNSNNKQISSLWCDGIEPKESMMKELIENNQILTRAWIGKDGQQEYRMEINFGQLTKNRYFKKQNVSDCLPNTDNMDWITLDINTAVISVNLP